MRTARKRLAYLRRTKRIRPSPEADSQVIALDCLLLTALEVAERLGEHEVGRRAKTSLVILDDPTRDPDSVDREALSQWFKQGS